jgi:hypothetical protein
MERSDYGFDLGSKSSDFLKIGIDEKNQSARPANAATGLPITGMRDLPGRANQLGRSS